MRVKNCRPFTLFCTFINAFRFMNPILPAVFNFLTFCMCGISYNEFLHFFPHTLPSWKNSSHFSNVWNFGKCSFPYINSTHVENSSHFLTLKFIATNNLLYFLTFSNVRKGFPHNSWPFFNFLAFCMCGIGYNEFLHIFPHTRTTWKVKWKNPYIFPMCWISANALFLTSILHMRKIPHFSSHWNSIAYTQDRHMLYYPGQKKSLQPKNSWGWSTVRLDIVRYRASVRHRRDSRYLRVASLRCWSTSMLHDIT